MSVARPRRPGLARAGRFLGGVLCMLVSLEVSCRFAEHVLARARGIVYEPMPRVGLSKAQRFAILRLIEGSSAYYIHSPDYGWTIRPGGAHGPYRANAQGLRADREYSPRPAPGVVRIACFGESYTHGDDVAHSNAWTTVLEAGAGAVEVLNFGVGGFGLDQAYLRFAREGPGFHPDIVLIGYMTRNLKRHVNVFRPFVRPTTGMPLAKPRFHVEDGDLRLQPNPLHRLEDYRELLEDTRAAIDDLREHDYHARHTYHESDWDMLAKVRLFKMTRSIALKGRDMRVGGVYDRTTEPYAITLLLLERFVAHVRELGATPVVVLFPDEDDLTNARKGAPLPYAPLREDLAARGYGVIDTYEGFREVAELHTVRTLCHGHYSPLGNRIVGEHVLRALRMQGLLPSEPAPPLPPAPCS